MVHDMGTNLAGLGRGSGNVGHHPTRLTVLMDESFSAQTAACIGPLPSRL